MIFGQEDGNPSTSVTNYININACRGASWTGTEANRASVCPCAFTLTGLRIAIDTAPGTGKSYTFTVMKNGVATILSVPLTDAMNKGEDTVNSVTFAAGDTISLSVTPSGTPAAPNNQYWSMFCDTASAIFPMFNGQNTAPSNSATNYCGADGGQGVAWNAADILYVVCPIAGTIKNLYAMANGVAGAGNSYTLTLMVNGVASSLAAIITGAVSASGNDTSHSVSVNAGDVLSFRSTIGVTPTSRAITMAYEFDPTTDGESFIGFGSIDAGSTSATQFEQILGVGANSWNATESNRIHKLGRCQMTKLFVVLGTAPGVGASRTFTLRSGNVDTLLTLTISDANTTGNVAAAVNPATSDSQLGMKSVPANTPAANTNGVHTGVAMFFSRRRNFPVALWF